MAYRIVKDHLGQWLDARGDTPAAQVEAGPLGAKYFYTTTGVAYQWDGSDWAVDEGPGTLVGDLIGNVTGDVTGNLTGDVSGDVTGNVSGNVTGNVTGDVTGNVSGDLIGTNVLVDYVEANNGNIGEIRSRRLIFHDDLVTPLVTWRLQTITYNHVFSGDGTIIIGQIPAESTLLAMKIEVTAEIAGDDAALFDVGIEGGDADFFTPTQLTVAAGVKGNTFYSPTMLETTAGATDIEINVSVFEGDGTTAADPTSGDLAVSILVLTWIQ